MRIYIGQKVCVNDPSGECYTAIVSEIDLNREVAILEIENGERIKACLEWLEPLYEDEVPQGEVVKNEIKEAVRLAFKSKVMGYLSECAEKIANDIFGDAK